ncbi:MAG: methyltransferase domain-containing protein [Methanomassiliicoccales archaeon]|nr:MAG: methyltransferase domain-containing protein [Methanomassiliicoccales archaeon]
MEYYDTIAPGYDELYREEQEKKHRLIKRYLDIRENDRLLDVGCGTGLSSEIFRCRLFGVEPSKDMLTRAKKKHEDAVFLQAKAECLPFKDNAFEIVISVTAIHNFEDPKRALIELKRVGRGKGSITILKKAKCAQELKAIIEITFEIEKVLEEEKDIILFYGIGPSKK